MWNWPACSCARAPEGSNAPQRVQYLHVVPLTGMIFDKGMARTITAHYPVIIGGP